MTHAEVVIARRSVEEGRGLVVVVNKMDLLSGRKNSELYKKVKEAVPLEIQTVIPQVRQVCNSYSTIFYGVSLNYICSCLSSSNSQEFSGPRRQIFDSRIDGFKPLKGQRQKFELIGY